MADLSRQVNALTDLRDPLTKLLNQAAPEKLLQRVDDITAELAEGDDSPIAGDPPDSRAMAVGVLARADPDVESLRADVERLEAELKDASPHGGLDIGTGLNSTNDTGKPNGTRSKRMNH